ncbi:probable plastid-lipid-associated protein 4, chloroplastic isoform X5 [Capsicum annuum]|uniref:probable plastid-lipid-associated protein 4, chloroplastic isoform X5 n=1 Tax=Capsicum annuum TaxID=4072 RepID=UPI001FB13DF0|nr:probable plastid-lipid-associated protein 4, chloroplastic isoform X5 [Capsicum annuum]
MALSSLSPSPLPTHVATQYSTKLYLSHSTSFSFPAIQNPHHITTSTHNKKWRTNVSFFPAFFNKTKDATPIKQELLEAIVPLDRGADATSQDQQIIDQRPKILRSRVNYQAVNVDTLRAQNMEGWPFFNQVTADLTPLNANKVAVKFDYFKIAGLIPIKAPGRARGELEITYLDEELRVSRGDLGNLFILKMVDPSYKVPT